MEAKKKKIITRKKAVVKTVVPEKKLVVTKKIAATIPVPLHDKTGKEIGTAGLNKKIFGAKINKQLISQYVKVYLANQRQGTSSTKTRSEVVGSTKKIYKQKGTGRARHGARKAPIFVGGGITFGPKPRDYSLKINKKQKVIAFISSLSQKAKEKKIKILKDEVEKLEPKTKIFKEVFEKAGLDKGSLAMVTFGKESENFKRAIRNIYNIENFNVESLNAYDVLKHEYLVFLESSLSELEKKIKV